MYDMSVLYSPRKLANCVPDLCARPSRYAHTIPEAVCTVATIESADGGNVALSILYATRAISITTSSYRLHCTGVLLIKLRPGASNKRISLEKVLRIGGHSPHMHACLERARCPGFHVDWLLAVPVLVAAYSWTQQYCYAARTSN